MPKPYEIDEPDLEDILSSLDDEERARHAREWCLPDLSSAGSGPQATLNRAISGDTEERQLLHIYAGDEQAVADIIRARRVAREVKTRRAPYLSRADVQEVYDAAGCLGQVYGLACNALITIAYKVLGLDDPSAETKLLTAFLDEAAGQMKRWGHPFHTIYVHENSQERGRHTHILATIDMALKKAFQAWAREGAKSFFWRHCRCATKEAVDIQVKGPRTSKTKAAWQYDRLMYLTKGLDPAVMDRDTATGKLTPLYDLMGLKEEWRNRPAGIVPYKLRVGASQSIAGPARLRLKDAGLPILSPFADRAWSCFRLNYIGFGWEFEEHEVREREIERRKRFSIINAWDEDVLAACRAASRTFDGLTVDEKRRLLPWILERRATAAKNQHPYEWPRKWTGWWLYELSLQRWGGRSAREGMKRIGLAMDVGNKEDDAEDLLNTLTL